MTNDPKNANEPEIASESAAEEADLADSDLEEVSGGFIRVNSNWNMTCDS